MAQAYFSTNTELGLINALTQSLTVFLPQNAPIGKNIFIKDAAGNSLRSTITVQTQGSDTFEDGSTQQFLNSAYESMQLTYNPSKWYVTGGTMYNTMKVSTLQGLQVQTSNLSTQNITVSSFQISHIPTSSLGTFNSVSSFLYYNNFNIGGGLRTAIPQTLNKNSFSPYSIGGLQLWLDAADTNAVVTSGGNVVRVFDKSANGLTMDATGTVPYNLASQNGLNTIGNLTTANYLSTSSTNFDFGTTDFAIFATLKMPATVGSLYPIISKNYGFGTGAATNNYWLLYVGNANPANISFVTIPNNAAFISVGSPTATSNSWVVSSAVAIRNQNNYSGMNGTLNTGNTTQVFLNAGLSSIIIGASLSGSSPLSFTSLVGEILVYKGTFTIFQRQQMEGYLAWKWGLQANLPATHPFYNAPPQ